MTETLLELIRGIRQVALGVPGSDRHGALTAREIVRRRENAPASLRFPVPIHADASPQNEDTVSERRQQLDRLSLSLRRQVELRIANNRIGADLDETSRLPVVPNRPIDVPGRQQRGAPAAARIRATGIDRAAKRGFVPVTARRVVSDGATASSPRASVERRSGNEPTVESPVPAQVSAVDTMERIAAPPAEPHERPVSMVQTARAAGRTHRADANPPARSTPSTEFPAAVVSTRNMLHRLRPEFLPGTALRLVNRQPARRDVATRRLFATDSDSGNALAGVVPDREAGRSDGESLALRLRTLFPPSRQTPGLRRSAVGEPPQAEHRTAGHSEPAGVTAPRRPVPFDQPQSGPADQEHDFESILSQTAANLKTEQQAQESTIRMLEQITAQAEQYERRISELEDTLTLRRFNDL